MKYEHLSLKLLEPEFSYHLLSSSKKLSAVLDKASKNNPVAVFYAGSEVSLIAPSHLNVSSIKSEAGWRALQIEGDMPFGTVQGLIAKITADLFDEKVGVCVISTFLTDIFFVKSQKIKVALEALKKAGWKVSIESTRSKTP